MFKNLRVIELAGVLAGPSVGMFFSELGAEVIKIENRKTGGDVTRSWKLGKEDKNSRVSAYFSAVNYKKKYLFKDLKSTSDLLEIKDLINGADVLLTNFKDGYAEKYGLDYPALSKTNPQLILGQISGYANEPNRVAFDLILQAESGIMSMNGQAEGPPTKMPIALIDVLAGHQLKEGILCAMLEKAKTGKGKLVSVSLFDTAIASLANQASNWLMADHLPSRIGSMHPNIAPYGELFITKDNNTITFAIGSDKQFESLCRLLTTKWDQNDLFNSNTQRVINRKDLFSTIAPVIKSFDFEFLDEGCRALQIPMAKIKNLKEVFENPYTDSLILEEEIDGVPTKRVRTVAFK